ncbi:MAG: hypothetical protein NT062_08180 [Proteobacteria bacterium]|nr:hypothetical protein [Pseudomonadota bacterium]
MRPAVLLSALLLPAVPMVARAESSATITLTPEGTAFAATLGKTPAELAADLKAKVDAAYETADIPGFLRAFTDATAFSQRGIGVDYASHPDHLIFGIAGNVAAASDSVVDKQEHPTGGAAVNFAAMAGLNLRDQGFPKWTLFVSGFYQGYATDKLDGSITSAGAHAQYRLLEPQDDGAAAKVVRWLGLDLTGGLEYTRWKLGASKLTNTFQLAGGGGQTAEVDVLAEGNFDLTSNAMTIPVEVTTGLRIALIASLFIGAGIDFTVGKSEVAGDLTGDINTKANPSLKIGTLALTANGDNTASPAAGRILAGAQVNLWKLKIFVQGNVSQTPAASVAFGLRMVF